MPPKTKKQRPQKAPKSEKPKAPPEPDPIPGPPVITPTFGFIKQQAKPGSWRRGYGYFRENQIQDIDLDEKGVVAKIKGKFKESYTTRIKFFGDQVRPDCDCPLDENWCKHAVAVALEAVERHMWEAYYNLPVADDLVDFPTDFEGRYRFFIKNDKNPKPRHISVRMEERASDKIVHNLEGVLKKAVEYVQSSEDGFNKTEMRELAVMKHVLQYAKKPDHGWYQVPVSDADQLMQLLSQVEELYD